MHFQITLCHFISQSSYCVAFNMYKTLFISHITKKKFDFAMLRVAAGEGGWGLWGVGICEVKLGKSFCHRNVTMYVSMSCTFCYIFAYCIP